MHWQEILGLTAGLIGNISIVPQVWKLFRYKTAYEISLPFLCLWLTSTVCWLAYGISLSLLSLILWNSITLLLASLIMYAKLKWGMRAKQPKTSPGTTAGN
ncbi:MAG: PQ-loop domain-containing transporter [Dehalococcoidia bacterium]|jgi:MtN3 and saliva related transmembrane protein